MRLRQKSIDFGKTSMFEMTVAPVVVNPEMVSKYASENELNVLSRINGRVAKSAAAIQPRETIIKPSLCVICLFSGGEGHKRTNAKPETTVITVEIIKDFIDASPYIKATATDDSMLLPRKISRNPSILEISKKDKVDASLC